MLSAVVVLAAACNESRAPMARHAVALPDSLSDLSVDSVLTAPVVRGRQVALPATFAAALTRYSPAFAVLGRHDLSKDARDYIVHDTTLSRSPVFGVVADFDGDGRQDAVVMGRKNDTVVTLALMNRPTGVDVIAIDSVPTGPRPATGWAFHILTPQPAGTVKFEYLYEDEPKPGAPQYGTIELKHSGFVIAAVDVAGTLYYWRDGKFQSFQISD